MVYARRVQAGDDATNGPDKLPALLRARPCRQPGPPVRVSVGSPGNQHAAVQAERPPFDTRAENLAGRHSAPPSELGGVQLGQRPQRPVPIRVPYKVADETATPVAADQQAASLAQPSHRIWPP